MKHTKHLLHREYLFILISLLITLLVTAFALQLLHKELTVKRAITKKIDYDAFRKIRLDEEDIRQAKLQSERILNKYPKLYKKPYMDQLGCLTFSMMTSSYDLINSRLADDEILQMGIGKLAQTTQFKEVYNYYKAIIGDLKYFPVPKTSGKKADVSYVDSWYQPRKYGGDRKHEGTDLMASNNKSGYFPVVSITDGAIEKMGWLEQGGYRIGIRSVSGGYFYYAHLASYAPELKEGDTVIAGQLIGFMGDTGYGEEGTTGQFDVHLHLGIYINTENGEMSVDPYPILKMLETSRTVCLKK